MKSYSSASSSQGSAFEGDFIIHPGCRHMRYKPTQKGESAIRVVPCIRNGIPEPMITNPDIIGGEGLSECFMEVDLATYLGTKRYHMVAPPPVPGETKGIVHHFYDFIKKYEETSPVTCPGEWRRWLGKKHEGDRDTPPRVLMRPTPNVLVQGYLIMHSGEVCTNKEGKEQSKWPVVLCLTPSARKDFMEKVFSLLDANAPWGPRNNGLGDCVDLRTGRLLVVSPHEVIQNKRPQTHYKVECDTDPYPLALDDAVQVWKPWEEVLDLHPSMEETAIRLAQTFSASAVFKAFEECPVYSQVLTNDTLLRMLDTETRAATIPVAPVPPPMPRVRPPQFTPPPEHLPPPVAQPSFPPAPDEADEDVEDPEEQAAPPPATSMTSAIQAKIAAAKARLPK